jgi:hypothetical protein
MLTTPLPLEKNKYQVVCCLLVLDLNLQTKRRSRRRKIGVIRHERRPDSRVAPLVDTGAKS